jgi:HPt (histidine-containing phosphotransfer) domain-containing protein
MACDGDALLLRQMIAIFRADAPSQMRRVEAALRERDAVAVLETAHKLHGLLAPFSTTAADAAKTLEHAGAIGQLGNATGTFASLVQIVAELLPLLEVVSIDTLKARPDGPDVLGIPR